MGNIVVQLLLIGYILVGKQALYGQALSTNLRACYSFDGNGTELMSNLTATLSSVTATVDRNSNANSALACSGSTNSFIELPNSPLIKPNAFTFAAWIKPGALNSSYILYTASSGSTSTEAYSLKTASISGAYRFVATKGDGVQTSSVVSTSTLNTNLWYHVIILFDNNILRIQINGASQAFVTSTFAPSYDPAKKIYLGGTNEVANNAPFTGIIDDVKIEGNKIELVDDGKYHLVIV